MIHRRQAPLKPIKEWRGEKPPLEVTAIPVYRVNYRTLQDYLKKVFGMEVKLMQVLGLTPGMAPVYTVSATKPCPVCKGVSGRECNQCYGSGRVKNVAAINHAQQCDNIRRGYHSKNMNMIFYVLCLDGFIPPGQYILDTSRPESRLERYRELVEEHKDPLHRVCVDFRNQFKLVDKEFYQQSKNLKDAFIAEQKRKRRSDVAE